MNLKIIILGIIFAIGIAVLVVWYRHDAKQSDCRTCRHNNWGECESKILCESGEMWEERGGDGDGR